MAEAFSFNFKEYLQSSYSWMTRHKKETGAAIAGLFAFGFSSYWWQKNNPTKEQNNESGSIEIKKAPTEITTDYDEELNKALEKSKKFSQSDWVSIEDLENLQKALDASLTKSLPTEPVVDIPQYDIHQEQVPQQEDGSSCGYHALNNAEYLYKQDRTPAPNIDKNQIEAEFAVNFKNWEKLIDASRKETALKEHLDNLFSDHFCFNHQKYADISKQLTPKEGKCSFTEKLASLVKTELQNVATRHGQILGPIINDSEPKSTVDISLNNITSNNENLQDIKSPHQIFKYKLEQIAKKLTTNLFYQWKIEERGPWRGGCARAKDLIEKIEDIESHITDTKELDEKTKKAITDAVMNTDDYLIPDIHNFTLTINQDLLKSLVKKKYQDGWLEADEIKRLVNATIENPTERTHFETFSSLDEINNWIKNITNDSDLMQEWKTNPNARIATCIGTMRQHGDTSGSRGHWYTALFERKDGEMKITVTDSLGTDRTSAEPVMALAKALSAHLNNASRKVPLSGRQDQLQPKLPANDIKTIATYKPISFNARQSNRSFTELAAQLNGGKLIRK